MESSALERGPRSTRKSDREWSRGADHGARSPEGGAEERHVRQPFSERRTWRMEPEPCCRFAPDIVPQRLGDAEGGYSDSAPMLKTQIGSGSGVGSPYIRRVHDPSPVP